MAKIKQNVTGYNNLKVKQGKGKFEWCIGPMQIERRDALSLVRITNYQWQKVNKIFLQTIFTLTRKSSPSLLKENSVWFIDPKQLEKERRNWLAEVRIAKMPFAKSLSDFFLFKSYNYINHKTLSHLTIRG